MYSDISTDFGIHFEKLLVLRVLKVGITSYHIFKYFERYVIFQL